MVKTIKPNEVSTPKLDKAKAKVKRFKSQMDEARAGAKSYDKEEEQMLITSKLRQRIEYQNMLRRNYLAMAYKHTEIQELVKLHNEYDTSYELADGTKIHGEFGLKRDDKGNVLYGFIKTGDGKEHKAETVKRNIQGITEDHKPKWWGLPMPKVLLGREIEIQLHDFDEIKGKVMYMSTELRKLGFSKVEVDAVRKEGKFISNIKVLEAMEKVYVDKQAKDKGVIDGRK